MVESAADWKRSCLSPMVLGVTTNIRLARTHQQPGCAQLLLVCNVGRHSGVCAYAVGDVAHMSSACALSQ